MKGRLIWFFGPSSAGKETLIRRAFNDQQDPVRRRLMMEEPMEICRASLDAELNRDDLAEAISQRYGPGVTQLIKGQSSDIWNWTSPPRDLPGQLRRLLPECLQEVVFVWADPAELQLRCTARGQQIDCFRELHLQIGWVVGLELPTLCVKNQGEQADIDDAPPQWPST